MEMQIGKVSIDDLHSIDPYLSPERLLNLIKICRTADWILMRLGQLSDMLDANQEHISSNLPTHSWIKKEIDDIIKKSKPIIQSI